MKETLYVCQKCGYASEAPGNCPNCGSVLVASCPSCGNPMVGEQISVSD